MKKRASVTLAAMWLFGLSHLAISAPRLEWLDTEHNFGAFSENMGIARCTFLGVNTGDSPLVVISARANCGCTTPSFPKDPVAPGDTLRIDVGYDPQGRPGMFTKRIYVTTNAEPAKTTLTIRGTVVGDAATVNERYAAGTGRLRLRSDIISYGEIDKGDYKNVYLEGYNHSLDSVRPVLVNVPPYISASIVPATVPPGETFVVSTFFDTLHCPQWDIVSDTFEVVLGRERIPVETLAVVREKLTPTGADPQVKIVPETVDLGRVSPDKPLKYTLEITNTGVADLALRRVYCLDPAVSLRLKGGDTLRPGRKARVEISVDPRRLTDPYLNARLIIITNDPARPHNVVRLLAELIR